MTLSLDETFEQLVIPILFGPPPVDVDAPVAVIVTGPASSGRGRVTAHMVADHPSSVALNIEDLRQFHPGYLSDAPHAQREATEAAAHWLPRATSYARAHKHSLILDIPLSGPDAAPRMSAAFAEQGYRTRVVVVVVPQAVSLALSASRYFRGRITDPKTPPPSLRADTQAWKVTRELVQRAAAHPDVDTLSIYTGQGQVVYPKPAGPGRTPDPARAFDRARALPLTKGEAAQWLSELRRITVHARNAADLPQPVAQIMHRLHTLAGTQVVQQVVTDANSPTYRRIVEQAAADRRTFQPEPEHRPAPEQAARPRLSR